MRQGRGKKLFNFRWVTAPTLLLLGALPAPVHAAPIIKIELTGGATPSPSNLKGLLASAQKVAALPFFKSAPQRWGILIDGSWRGASGYTEESLRDSEGAPAILLAPHTADDAASAWKTLIHELTHLMHFKTRPGEETWIQEGLALLAEQRLTGGLNPAFREAMFYPEASLTETADPSDDKPETLTFRLRQYGHLLQYFLYVHRLCGGDTFLHQALGLASLSKEDKGGTGRERLGEVLRANGGAHPAVCAGFKESFRAFQIARFTKGTDEEMYVHPTSLKPLVREPDDRIALPPFAASGNWPRTNPKGELVCEKGSVPVGAPLVCLKIRME